MTPRPFVPGLELSRALYTEAVAPTMDRLYPGVPYAAALIGPGSEVLGYDTEQSTDHDWGPRLLLFLGEADLAERGADIAAAAHSALPEQILGRPTSMATDSASEEREYHAVTVRTVGAYFESILGIDPRGPLRPADWLTFTEQHLRSLTAGAVFHDGVGAITRLREKLRYYPRDIWLYMLAAQWRRIAQEEAFMGRCAQVGDELGSVLVTGRLVRDLMRLCFLMERVYAPYIKWLGTGFRELECGPRLGPILLRALASADWGVRERELSVAYETVADMHNGLAITDPLPTGVTGYHGRPYLVISADRFADAIRARITDPDVLALPTHLGAVDQFADSTDAVNMAAQFRSAYGAGAA